MPSITDRVLELLALCGPADYDEQLLSTSWVRLPDEHADEMAALLLMSGGQYVSNMYKRDIGNSRGLLYMIRDLTTPQGDRVTLVDQDYITASLLNMPRIRLAPVESPTGSTAKAATERELSIYKERRNSRM